MPTVKQRLAELLSESMAVANRRTAEAFDLLAGKRAESIVLFGAGHLGRRTLKALRGFGIEPLAFSDNNAALWGKSVDGVRILSPLEAAARFGRSAAFVITIWNGRPGDRMTDKSRHLAQLGCTTVIPFGFLFWKYRKHLLPYFALDLPQNVLARSDRVWQGFDLFEDDESRREYVNQVAFRLRLEFDYVSNISDGVHYFPKTVVTLADDEVFVDCGSFTGDTIDSFLKLTGNQFDRIVAFEPDPRNWLALIEHVSTLPTEIRSKIVCLQQAVGARTEKVGFEATGTDLSSVGHGAVSVDAVKLDDAVGHVKPTFLKFDVEGSELDGLSGADVIITRQSPVLAVSAYHHQDHLWEIPLYLASKNAGYRFYLRAHSLEAWDLVCYAIPEHRLVSKGPEGVRCVGTS